MIANAPPPTLEPPLYIHAQDIQNWDLNGTRVPQTGSFSYTNTTSFSNLSSVQVSVVSEWDKKQIKAHLVRYVTQRLNHVKSLFQTRFEADKKIFEGIEHGKVFGFCHVAIERMLTFFPSKITADVTMDVSIVVQAHWGNVHFAWETFFDPEEEIPYSTLNISHNKCIIYSKGGDFPQVKKEFEQIMISSLK